MEIKVEHENGTLIAQVEGRVDSANAREFEQVLTAALGDAKTVIVDFEGLSYISSSGLRVLLLVAKTLRQRSAHLALCSLSESIREVFEISGFDKIIQIHNSRADALAAQG